ncbi:SDR family NAD(P)-dependent oxidoreductase [Nocardia sp. 004]|uniref:SDR family NAD(P)-dependent oxidoreductase n=1 Tax=Nocardia sp. 004 TaxID=3385978 RepID=UPI0039A19220
MFGSDRLLGRSRRTYGAHAVVTGAGSGIGRAFALEIAARGGHVLCADIDAERADETVALIERTRPGVAHTFHCDVARHEDLKLLAHATEALFELPVDLVINNAGVGVGGTPVGHIGFDNWQWTLDINLRGVVHGCEVFTPRLRAAGRGGIINVSSAAGFAAAPSMAAYNVSKAGVLALSETMAAELSGTGVVVTVVCPTFVQTNVARDGRITEESAQLADFLMRWIGSSPARIARTALDSHDRGQLYALPQLDAQLVWLLKRHFPARYTYALGLLKKLLPHADSSTTGNTSAATRTGS